jgi:uncharacterized integral membrane protein (TIGR00697 family)
MHNNQQLNFPIMLSILLIFLSILFFIPDVVMYKLVKIGPIEESAAILFFPFVYSIADSITEVYGRKKTFIILISCYAISLFFSILIKWVIHLPSSQGWEYQQAYDIVFGKGPWVMVVGIISVGASMYVNVKLMSRLKYKMRGQHFIIRSMISSSFGELIVTGIGYPLIFFAMSNSLFTLMINAYLFKLAYSMVAAFPARFLVFLLREVDGIKYAAFNEELHYVTKGC